jgi:hypothetical protein
MAKFVESFGPLSRLAPAVSRTLSVFRSSRSQPGDPHQKMTEAVAFGLARGDFLKRTDSTDEVLRIILDDRERVGMANSVPEAIRYSGPIQMDRSCSQRHRFGSAA